jgi:hypothetical protein
MLKPPQSPFRVGHVATAAEIRRWRRRVSHRHNTRMVVATVAAIAVPTAGLILHRRLA